MYIIMLTAILLFELLYSLHSYIVFDLSVYSTEIRKKRSRFWTGQTWIRRSLVTKRWLENSVSRRRSFRVDSPGGSGSSPSCGPCSTNRIRRMLPRCVNLIILRHDFYIQIYSNFYLSTRDDSPQVVVYWFSVFVFLSLILRR